MQSSGARDEPERTPGLEFGEVAETYDRVRPGYPSGHADDALAWSATLRGGRPLEIWLGMGKPTVLFAARGLEIVCLKPSVERANVGPKDLRLMGRCQGHRCAIRGMAGRASAL